MATPPIVAHDTDYAKFDNMLCSGFQSAAANLTIGLCTSQAVVPLLSSVAFGAVFTVIPRIVHYRLDKELPEWKALNPFYSIFVVLAYEFTNLGFVQFTITRVARSIFLSIAFTAVVAARDIYNEGQKKGVFEAISYGLSSLRVVLLH
ncbi:MAG: hypothetical protein AAGF04_03415 [Chlamydiota bacterium]